MPAGDPAARSPTPSTTSCAASRSPAASATTTACARPAVGRQDRHHPGQHGRCGSSATRRNLATASMIAGANQRRARWVTLDGQTVGGSYISTASGSDDRRPDVGRRDEGHRAVAARRRLRHAARPGRRGRADHRARHRRHERRAGPAGARGRRLHRRRRRLPSTPATPRTRSPTPRPAAGSHVGQRRRRSRSTSPTARLRRPGPAAPAGTAAAAAATAAVAAAAAAVAARPRRRRRQLAAATAPAARPGPDRSGRAAGRAGQPSWRRTSAATAPPSARPLTWGWTTPITRPMAFMPSPAAPVCSTAAVTSADDLLGGELLGQVVGDHGGLGALLVGHLRAAAVVERGRGLAALLGLASRARRRCRRR